MTQVGPVRNLLWTGPVPLSIAWPGSNPGYFVHTGAALVYFLPDHDHVRSGRVPDPARPSAS